MQLSINIDTNDPEYASNALAAKVIAYDLREIADAIGDGDTSGSINNSNGYPVGSWTYEPDAVSAVPSSDPSRPDVRAAV